MQALTHVDQYLALGREYGASDVHLATDFPPAWRLNGSLKVIWKEHSKLLPADTEQLARSFLAEKEWNRLQEVGDVDFAYSTTHGRYRASVVRQRLGYDLVFRIINTEVRSIESLNLPLDHIVPLTRYQNGLILVTGSVGSGKSTTLAALLDFINREREDHILTLEDRWLKADSIQSSPQLPIGKARIARPGKHATVVAYSAMVHEAIRAADRLVADGWDIEVVDLRSIKPLDIDTVLASIARTGRLLAVGEAFPWGGVTAEVVSRVSSEGFHLLDAPPMRLNSRDTPVPYHPNLWAAHRPTPESICHALRQLLSF